LDGQGGKKYQKSKKHLATVIQKRTKIGKKGGHEKGHPPVARRERLAKRRGVANRRAMKEYLQENKKTGGRSVPSAKENGPRRKSRRKSWGHSSESSGQEEG